MLKDSLITSCYDYASQIANPNITCFTLEVAIFLLELIYTSDDDRYLHLPGLIVAENAAGELRYLMPDGLGSIRQAVDSQGEVAVYHEFDPYGSPIETGGDPYGFTGEWWEDEVALLHLRARWYAPGVGIFLSRDPVEGEPPYAYVRGNVVNLTDPSGRTPLPKSQADPRDLTDWLYREMVDNANDPAVRKLKAMNELATLMAEEVVCDVKQAIAAAVLDGVPVGPVTADALMADKYPIVGATALHGLALYEYSQLVKDGAIFDYKDEVGIKLGPGITLCAGPCYNDIEYSFTGNVHFAYIGGASGIPGWEIQAGAGYAEIDDPAHDPDNLEQYAGPYEAPPIWQMIGWTPWDPSTLNFGDEPKDHEAVTLGIKLWEKYEDRMTRSQFESELARYIGKLSRCAPDPDPPPEDVLRVWTNNGFTYPLGYFDNLGRAYKLPEGRCP